MASPVSPPLSPTSASMSATQSSITAAFVDAPARASVRFGIGGSLLRAALRLSTPRVGRSPSLVCPSGRRPGFAGTSEGGAQREEHARPQPGAEEDVVPGVGGVLEVRLLGVDRVLDAEPGAGREVAEHDDLVAGVDGAAQLHVLG